MFEGTSLLQQPLVFVVSANPKPVKGTFVHASEGAPATRHEPTSIGPCAQSAEKDAEGFGAKGDMPFWPRPEFPAATNSTCARTYSSPRTSSSGLVRPALMSSIASFQRPSSRPAFASASI